MNKFLGHGFVFMSQGNDPPFLKDAAFADTEKELLAPLCY